MANKPSRESLMAQVVVGVVVSVLSTVALRSLGLTEIPSTTTIAPKTAGVADFVLRLPSAEPTVFNEAACGLAIDYPLSRDQLLK